MTLHTAITITSTILVTCAFIAVFINTGTKKTQSSKPNPKPPQPPATDKYPDIESDPRRILFRSFLTDGCKVCRGSHEDFLMGPQGGLSMNVKCPKCGTVYNVTGALCFAEIVSEGTPPTRGERV